MSPSALMRRILTHYVSATRDNVARACLHWYVYFVQLNKNKASFRNYLLHICFKKSVSRLFYRIIQILQEVFSYFPFTFSLFPLSTVKLTEKMLHALPHQGALYLFYLALPPKRHLKSLHLAYLPPFYMPWQAP